ncbi:MAG: glycosyltransferase [Promicromonosporaceae bacterium]|nr:glycosyltransferase [Promicromonosporaceae bacterium]
MATTTTPPVPDEPTSEDAAVGTSPLKRRLRFAASWLVALGLVAVGLPKAVGVTWHGVVPALQGLTWSAALTLAAVWLAGLLVHTFVLTAAAPALTHRRALTLNLTGSAVSNVLPVGGAAGMELNRRMMRTWGIDVRAFTGFTVLTNLWDVGSKLLLPAVAVAALVYAGDTVGRSLLTAGVLGGVAFVALVAGAWVALRSPAGAARLGRALSRAARAGLRLVGKDRPLDLVPAVLELRRECEALVTRGWLRMTMAIGGYVALQAVLLGLCLHVTGAGVAWPIVLAGFAVERLLTILPLTPGGVGVADLGMVGVLLALGADPTAATAAAVLYRVFVFALEIPVGGGALGLWLLGRRRAGAADRTGWAGPAGEVQRVAHVTDVFLPRLGGIETHVDDLVRHQRAAGLDAVVLTPTEPAAGAADPAWVRRLPAGQARRAVGEYDVVHVHLSLVSPYGLAVARAAAKSGVPTLVTVHSMWSGAGLALRVAAMGMRLAGWPVVWSAVSGAAAASFGKALPGVEVAVLPNALDVAAWQRPSGEAERAGSVLVSTMRLAPRKRPIQLLRTFEQVRALAPEADARLVIVGDGRLRRRVERRVQRRGLGEHVRVTGRLTRDQVLAELGAASVYVAPAPKESFGIAALEARCTGLPVVARRCSGVGEFVTDGLDGLLVDDDAALAPAVARLLSEAPLRERITAHNALVPPPFDWADALDRTAALYRAATTAARPVAQPAPVAVPVLVGA